jgi:hypothetical protein
MPRRVDARVTATPMKRLWLLVAAVALTGGWMAFDGAHALITGDFVTPASGEYAGQLGPWAAILRRAGIEPRSPGVAVSFVVFGLAYLGALVSFLLRRWRPRGLLAACAVVSILYLPFGTVAGAAALAVLASLPSHGVAPE